MAHDMAHKIKTIVPLKNGMAQVRFANGVVKDCNMFEIVGNHPAFSEIKTNPDLFQTLHVIDNGHGAEFDGELDMDSELLWEKGVEVKSPFGDFLSFSDAVKIWGLSESTLRKSVANKKLIEDIDAKNFGTQWVVTVTAMIREYGSPANAAEYAK